MMKTFYRTVDSLQLREIEVVKGEIFTPQSVQVNFVHHSGGCFDRLGVDIFENKLEALVDHKKRLSRQIDMTKERLSYLQQDYNLNELEIEICELESESNI